MSGPIRKETRPGRAAIPQADADSKSAIARGATSLPEAEPFLAADADVRTQSSLVSARFAM